MFKKKMLLTLICLLLGSVLLEAKAYRPNNPNLSVDRPYRPGYFDKNNYYYYHSICNRLYGKNNVGYVSCMASFNANF